ncbi:MAG: hypothetical protein K2N48_08415 [Muribaculaceae bacterium]|nr:hypothetical protein [Muribaculaceae bacterium]
MPSPDNHYRCPKMDEARQEGYIVSALRSVFMGKTSKSEACAFFASNMSKENWTKEQIATRLGDIKVMLRGIDFRSLRSMRSILTGQDTKEDREELMSLEKTARELRAEAANLAMLQLDMPQSKDIQ